ncbi:MAG: NAD(P)-dependent alcohol dehydrogenase [Acidimicrobiales bacterium]|nr:NAD(P)-dependent alcohol dehydrogenase [Acidimicrobiales bacterium]
MLVEVHAAGVNRGDALEMRGWPYLARVMGYGIRRPKHPVLGTDVAGTVIALSEGVSEFDVGDEIVGFATGAFAELATLPASTAVHRPETISAEAAAAMPTTAVTALQAIRDAARVEPGQHVAIIGASGGVGTFAVQIAKAHGAEVTGVASGRNADLVRSIGADHVLDYATDDIAMHTGRYDAIVDLVGNQAIRSLRHALTPTGTFVVVGGQNPQTLTGMRRFAAAAAMSPFTRQRLVPLFSKPNRDDLDAVIELARTGAVRPIVGRAFELSDIAEAIRQIETGHGVGRTVVTIGTRTTHGGDPRP